MSKRDMEYLALGMALNHQAAPRTEYVTRTVHEHRAPTDESIRLAREYEEKAWNTVRDRITEPLISINANYVLCEKTDYDRRTHIFFKINEKPVRLSIDDGFHSRGERFDAIAKEIANEVLKLLERTQS